MNYTLIQKIQFDFSMDFINVFQIDNHQVMVFKKNSKSNLNSFINQFKAKKIECSHNEDELYGIIIE